MTRIRRWVLALAVLLVPATALAAPPSSEQVDRLMEVMRVERTLDLMWPRIEELQKNAIAGIIRDKKFDAKQRDQLDAVMTRFQTSLRTTMSWQNMQPIYRDIYARTFDAADVEAVTAFYASPAGQRLLDKMPQLMHNSMQATQQLLVPALQQLQKDIETEFAKPGPAD